MRVLAITAMLLLVGVSSNCRQNRRSEPLTIDFADSTAPIVVYATPRVVDDGVLVDFTIENRTDRAIEFDEFSLPGGALAVQFRDSPLTLAAEKIEGDARRRLRLGIPLSDLGALVKAAIPPHTAWHGRENLTYYFSELENPGSYRVIWSLSLRDSSGTSWGTHLGTFEVTK